MIFLNFLILKRFLPQPWYTIPDINDSFRRLLCKGWNCNIKGYHQHQSDEFSNIIGSYINMTLKGNFKDQLYKLVDRGYDPALCAIGFFELIGYEGFKQNFTSSYNNLIKGSNKGLWSCDDTLAFHPFYNLSINLTGGVWSMIKFSLNNIKINITESILILKHIVTASSTTWWKRRRSGEEFSDNIGIILGLYQGNITKSWEILLDLSKNGHLPASLWVSEGYFTGEIGEINYNKSLNILLPFIINGPWKIDLLLSLESNESFNKTTLYNISSQIGDNNGDILNSFNIFM